ncbi:igLON family member 5 isoform 1-T2 [Pholidichthys leucotaenia]
MGCPLLRNAFAGVILVLLCKGSTVHGAEFGHLPDNITVLEGESVTLRCRIDEEVTHKAWLNRSNILFTGTDKWSLDKRVTLVNSNNSDFSIHIDKVQVTDEGPYTCTFQANNMPRIAHVYLIVQVPARIVNISKNVSVNEGENVNLYCLAVGRPEPTVTWKDQKYGLVSEGEFLDITEIKRQQAEDYECITNNGVAPPDQRKVKVTVNYPPMITDIKNMPAHLGKTAILRCEAMAVPPASFEWYRDDHRPVESDNTLRIKNEKTRSLLLFTNVTEKHFGNYTCFASNRLGASNASMLLFTPPAPPKIYLEASPEPQSGQWVLLCLTGEFHPRRITLSWTYQSADTDIDHLSVSNCTLPSSNLPDVQAIEAPLSPIWLVNSSPLHQSKCLQVVDSHSREVYLFSVVFLPKKQSLKTGITFTCGVYDHPALTDALTASFTWDAPANELIVYLNILKMCFLSAMTAVFLLEAVKYFWVRGK